MCGIVGILGKGPVAPLIVDALKRRLQDRFVFANRRKVSPRELLTLLFGGLRAQAGREVAALRGNPPRKVILTVPALYGPAVERLLREAAQAAGFEAVELAPEPVAAFRGVQTAAAVAGPAATVVVSGLPTCSASSDAAGNREDEARRPGHQRPAAVPTVVVELEDNGPGFDKDHADKIFNPFFTTKPQGSGLGLAIVRKIVDAHDGRISVASPPSGGARFRVVLPLHGLPDRTEVPVPQDGGAPGGPRKR